MSHDAVGKDGPRPSRDELLSRLEALEREHHEVLLAALSVPGGAHFSQRLQELEHAADLIRRELSIPTRAGTELGAVGDFEGPPNRTMWADRRPVIKVVMVLSVILVAGGLALGAFALGSGYWGGIGGTINMILGGSFCYWFASTQTGRRTDRPLKPGGPRRR